MSVWPPYNILPLLIVGMSALVRLIWNLYDFYLRSDIKTLIIIRQELSTLVKRYKLIDFESSVTYISHYIHTFFFLPLFLKRQEVIFLDQRSAYMCVFVICSCFFCDDQFCVQFSFYKYWLPTWVAYPFGISLFIPQRNFFGSFTWGI